MSARWNGVHELARKELVRPARTSSMQGQREYGFWHVLVRDVCYGQIPRAARASRHVAAAAWIQGRAGERVDDLADVLAHHYRQALELSRVSGNEEDIPDWNGRRATTWPLRGTEPSLSKLTAPR